MLLSIQHETRYHYDGQVPYALQQVRLTPKSRTGHQVLEWSVSVSGGTREISYSDHNNNHVDLVRLLDVSGDVLITSKGIVETEDNNGIVGQTYGALPLWYFLHNTKKTKPGSSMRAFLKSFRKPDLDPIALMHRLSTSVLEAVRYETGKTHALTSAEEAMTSGHGVCQDHAHIFTAAARHMGYPARYVSGYLMMDGVDIQEATHAWAEVHIDNIGWVGYDISNGISPDERYVRVATGLDYGEAAPISGIRYGDAKEDMLVTAQVQQ